MSEEEAFFRILIAIDGSPHSKKAAEFAFNIIKGIGDRKVIVFGVSVLDLTKLSESLFVTGAESLDKMRIEEKRKEAQQWLEEIENMFKDNANQNVLFQSDILEDPVSKVSHVLLNYAQRANVNLIIVGTRGRTGVKKILLGSVASDIVSNAHCPVLVVR